MDRVLRSYFVKVPEETNPGKLRALHDLHQVWKTTLPQASRWYWQSFWSRGTFRNDLRSSGPHASFPSTLLGVAHRDSMHAAVAGQARSWTSNFVNRTRTLIRSSSIQDEQLLHALHWLNVMKLWNVCNVEQNNLLIAHNLELEAKELLRQKKADNKKKQELERLASRADDNSTTKTSTTNDGSSELTDALPEGFAFQNGNTLDQKKDDNDQKDGNGSNGQALTESKDDTKDTADKPERLGHIPVEATLILKKWLRSYVRRFRLPNPRNIPLAFNVNNHRIQAVRPRSTPGPQAFEHFHGWVELTTLSMEGRIAVPFQSYPLVDRLLQAGLSDAAEKNGIKAQEMALKRTWKKTLSDDEFLLVFPPKKRGKASKKNKASSEEYRDIRPAQTVFDALDGFTNSFKNPSNTPDGLPNSIEGLPNESKTKTPELPLSPLVDAAMAAMRRLEGLRRGQRTANAHSVVLKNSIELHRRGIGKKKSWYFKLVFEVQPQPWDHDDVEREHIVALDLGLRNFLASNHGDLQGVDFLDTLYKYDREIQKIQKGLQQAGVQRWGSCHRYRRLMQRVRGFIKTNVRTWLWRILSRHKPQQVVIEKLMFMEALDPEHGRKGLGKRMNRLVRGFGQKVFKEALTQWSEEFGFKVVEIDAYYTSQRCRHCHFVHVTNRNGNRFECKSCGYRTHADVQGSQNLERRSLQVADPSWKGLASFYGGKHGWWVVELLGWSAHWRALYRELRDGSPMRKCLVGRARKGLSLLEGSIKGPEPWRARLSQHLGVLKNAPDQVLVNAMKRWGLKGQLWFHTQRTLQPSTT